nr:LOW QUALITY PROTEIN: immunoglobulin superfamily containing leucine-rich repeat protein 2 [Loxodonta africana]
MATLRALWLTCALLGVAGACPEPCACVDKYAHQFADCAYKELREVPEGLPANVTTLSLSANKITVLRRGAFANVTQVTSLWLAHNEVRTVESGALAVLSQLKNLDLSHNLISSFPWSDLRNLSALQLLKMNHNRLSSLPGNALGALPDLRSLRINNNRLRTLAPGTFDELSALSHLQLYHNPFHCGCGLVWLQAWASSTRVSLPEPDSIACATPPALQGVPVHRLPTLPCAPPSVRLSSEPEPEAPGSPLRAGLTLVLHTWREREARVQLTPLAAHWSPEPVGAAGAGQPGRRPLRLLYLCPAGGGTAVQWSRVEEGVNAYWFRGLRPGTNYSVCLALAGEACHVQVVFATKKELPSLLVIVAVSVFLLVLATVPLLGAACCHLLAKHPGKPYRLILRPQAPDPMEKRIAADFDPRASYLESEKSYPAGGEAGGEEPEEAPGEGLDEDAEQEDSSGDLQREESLAACSLVESQSKANQEEFEAGSEYSDRLPLGAEAVNIAQEINGNYRQTEG